MKKKLLSLALACGMVFSLAACGTPANNDSPAPNTESPAIGTETPAADTPTYEPATVRVAYMPNLGSAGSLFVGRWITPPPCRMWWWATRPRALKPSRI